MGGGGETLDFFPRIGRGRHENTHSGDIFDQSSCERSSIRTELADHVGDGAVLSPKWSILMTSSRAEASNPPPSLIIKLFIQTVVVVVQVLRYYYSTVCSHVA